MHRSDAISGATDTQIYLLDYWRSKMDDENRVARTSICPGALRLHLSNISLVHMTRKGAAQFRLAGSGLRDIVGLEARGRLIADIPNLLDEAWVDGLNYVLETGKPAGGVNRQENDEHAWLRLPLYDQNQLLRIVLCHDELIPRVRFNANQTPIHTSIHDFATRNAA